MAYWEGYTARLPRHPLRADQLPPLPRGLMRDRVLATRGPSTIALASVGLFAFYSTLFGYQLRRASRSGIDDRLTDER